MNTPLLETDFNNEDISEANIHIVEDFTGVKLTAVEIAILQADGKGPSITSGLDKIGKLLWFDHNSHPAEILKQISAIIPDLNLKIIKAVRKFGISSKPPASITEKEIYKLRYSFGDDNWLFDDIFELEEKNNWLLTLLARIASHSSYSLIPLQEDVDSIYIQCTNYQFKAFYPNWEKLAQVTFDAPMPDVDSGSFKGLPLQKALKYKIFYKPIIYTVSDGKAAVLTYSGRDGVPVGERVKSGQTIAHAISENLKNTYAYKGRFEVKSFSVNDVTLDNRGIPILRFMSVIKLVDSFNLVNKPFDYTLSWNREGNNSFESMKVLLQGKSI